MSRNVKDVEKKDRTDLRGGCEENHPAFGQVRFDRVSSSGTVPMYGASTQFHPTFIRLRISRSYRVHDLRSDYYHNKGGPLIEVDLTPLQFADLLTTMNYSGGVPCTIRSVKGEDVPWIPVDDQNEIGRVRDGFKREVKEKFSESRMQHTTKVALDILMSKRPLKRADRDKICDIVRKISMAVSGNIPFVMDQFVSAAERVQSEVKREIESFMDMAIERAGIDAIGNMTVEEQKKLLTGGVDVDSGEGTEKTLHDGHRVCMVCGESKPFCDYAVGGSTCVSCEAELDRR